MNAYGLARIGRDAEVRFLDGGDAVINLSLAFSYGKKGHDGKRQTQWLDASMFGKRAEALAPHLTKGASVMANLSDVHIETYTMRDNTTGSKLVGRITDIEFAGPAPQRQEAPPPPPKPKPAPAPSGFDGMDDESIPF